MPIRRPRLRSPRWLPWPKRTARVRYTALFGGLFLLCGIVLVAITYVLFQRASAYTKPQLPQVPTTPAIEQLQQLQQLQQIQLPALPQAAANFRQDQNQLAQDQHQLGLSAQTPNFPVPTLVQDQQRLVGDQQQLVQDQQELTQDQQQLTQSQQQLTQAASKLTQAVHQMAQAGTAQTAQRAADSHQLLVTSGIALAIVAVLALLAGWLAAGRMLRPIRTITRTARRISSTSLHKRLALDGPQDELKELGDTLDDLFGRLEAAFEAQRHFVANASHELRTPLTRERTLVQVALGDPSTTTEVWRSTGHELLASNREQETLIEALLTLATSESGLDHREPVDLSVVAHSVLLSRPDTDCLGLRIDRTTASAPLHGDPRLLEALVANLVDNAITHNVEGGRVHVSSGGSDGTAWLSVSNSGPVISRTEIDRLFQPFQRLSPHRIRRNNGHGLGLSIVHAIATAHGATITAQPSPQGGLFIQITFPTRQN